MADLEAGEVFVDGEQGDAARLNNHVNGANVRAEFISGKTVITPASGDYLVFYDISGAVMGKATVDTLVRTIALNNQAAATASMRTIDGAANSAAPYTSLAASVTGVRKSAGAGTTDTAAVSSDYAQAPSIITLAGGVATADCALNTNFTVALPATTTACTITLNNVPNGSTIRIRSTQGATSASTLAFVVNTAAPGTTCTQKRPGGAGAITASVNAIDVAYIERWGTVADVTFKNALA